jgi:serine/threonine protein kinase
MSADPGNSNPAGGEELNFRRVNGDHTMQVRATFGPGAAVAPAFLAARPARLADGTELHQLRVADTAQRTGYDRLDNEILAGLWLREATASVGYPPEVSRLYGYEATSANPFALLDPYRGEPLTVAGRHLSEDEQHQFQVSLLTGLCWLAASGIAHRGIAPSTVWWDGQQAQITDFSMCSVIGALREPIGSPPWAAREQRQGTARGLISAQDDVWAAGRLIFCIYTQEELSDRRQVEERPALKDLLKGVFGPPEQRPTARELLTRLNEECPVPRALGSRSEFEGGRSRFYAARRGKHPSVAEAASAANGGSGDESGGTAQEPPGPVRNHDSSAASPFASEGSEVRGPLRGSRRWMRRSQTLMLLAAVGLAALPAATFTVLVR